MGWHDYEEFEAYYNALSGFADAMKYNQTKPVIYKVCKHCKRRL